MELQIVDTKNKAVGKVALDDCLKEPVNQDVLYYAVKAVRNGLRHGTAKVKDRHDISRTTAKPFRQKGTGNARHGAKKSNIFVGGASAHGPRPRNYSEKVNKKFKKLSYLEAFKNLLANDSVKVLKEWSFDKPSTKAAQAVLQGLGVAKPLIVVDQADETARKSFRNLKDVTVLHDNNLNVYELVRCTSLVTTQAVMERLKERWGV